MVGSTSRPTPTAVATQNQDRVHTPDLVTSRTHSATGSSVAVARAAGTHRAGGRASVAGRPLMRRV
jgi:hypothetical protein